MILLDDERKNNDIKLNTIVEDLAEFVLALETNRGISQHIFLLFKIAGSAFPIVIIYFTPMSIACIVCVIAYITIMAFYLWMQSIHNRHLCELKESTDNIYTKIISSIYRSTENITNNKYLTLEKELAEIIKNKKTPAKIISNPCFQLRSIQDELANCVADLLSSISNRVYRKDIYVSIIYNIPSLGKIWEYADPPQPSRVISAMDLISKKTTARLAFRSDETSMIFYNSKELAASKGHYYPVEDDVWRNGKLCGSIACKKIIVNYEGELLLQAILSFSTSNKPFVADSDERELNTVAYHIDENIIRSFIPRIKVELCLLGISICGAKSRKRKVNRGKLKDVST